MRNVYRRTTKIFGFAILILSLTACTKKRQDQFPQGQGQDLEKISDYDERVFSLETGDEILSEEGDNCRRSSPRSKDLTSLNDLNWIVAKANRSYKVITRVVEDQLLIYKMTSEDDLMPCEKPTGVKDGFHLVPIAQFRLELLRVEKERDLNGDPTSRLLEIKAKNRSEAQFVRVDRFSAKSFGEERFPVEYVPIDSIDKILNGKVRIETGAVIRSLKPFRSRTEPVIKTEKYKLYKTLDEVSYRVSGDHFNLLSGAHIYGYSNMTFDVEFRLIKDFLVVYKVGDERNLTLLEQDLAVKEGEKLLVPLMAYGVSYIKVRQGVDSRGLPQTELKKERLNHRAGATHIIIAKERAKSFSKFLVERQNIFPKEYFFDSDWYFDKKSVDKSNTIEGFGPSLGMEYNSSWLLGNIQKVRFRTKEFDHSMHLQLITLNDPNEDRDEYKAGVETFFGVERRIFTVNHDPEHFKEELISQAFDEKLHKGRVYYYNPFAGLNIDDIEIADDYISVTFKTEHITVNKFRMTLRRVDAQKKIEPREYPIKDQRRFGFFASAKPIKRELIVNEDDQVWYLNRFYPKDGVIRYHFAQGTPDKFKPLALKAVAQWNDVFHKAGTGLSVRVDDAADEKYLGDIRYNILNIVDVADDRLAGYGPSLVDPHTGEIVVATANVYINTLRSAKLTLLRNYIRFVRNELDTRYIYAPGANARSPFLVSNPETIRKIEYSSECAAFREYASKRKHSEREIGTEDELKILTPCAEYTMEDELLKTILHEMGHNFGLRHNFMASTDRENYPEPDVKGTSVMDYYPANVNDPTDLGPYDLAAIRYGYGQTRLTESELNRFKYCTDEDVNNDDYIRNKVVDCMRHDYGGDIGEVVDFRIHDLKSLISELFNRGKEDRWMGEFFNGNAWVLYYVDLVRDLNRVYAAWRDELTKYVSHHPRYSKLYNPKNLRHLSKDEYANLIADFHRDPKYSHFGVYRKASEQIFEFYMEFVSAPARQCVTRSPHTNEYTLLPLNTLRSEIFKQTGRSIVYCDDPDTRSHLSKKDLELVQSFGLFFDDVLDNQDEREKSQARISVVGTDKIRDAILNIISNGYGHHGYKMADDPVFREEFLKTLKGRILPKTDLRTLLAKVPLADLEQNSSLTAVFNQYKDEGYHFHTGLYAAYRSALQSSYDQAGNYAALSDIRAISNKDLQNRDKISWIQAWYESPEKREGILLQTAGINFKPDEHLLPVPYAQEYVSALTGTFMADILTRYQELSDKKRTGHLSPNEEVEQSVLHNIIDNGRLQ